MRELLNIAKDDEGKLQTTLPADLTTDEAVECVAEVMEATATHPGVDLDQFQQQVLQRMMQPKGT